MVVHPAHVTSVGVNDRTYLSVSSVLKRVASLRRLCFFAILAGFNVGAMGCACLGSSSALVPVEVERTAVGTASKVSEVPVGEAMLGMVPGYAKVMASKLDEGGIYGV